MACGVVFIDAVEVTPAVAGSWQDVDLSGHIDADATGVILEFEGVHTSGYNVGCRNDGSTDNYPEGYIDLHKHLFLYCGVANRICEIYVGHATRINVYLHGYFREDAEFLVNGIDHTPGVNGWSDVDISGDGFGDIAIGAVGYGIYPGSATDWGARCNGSTDNRDQDFAPFGFIVGCDESEIFEFYAGDHTLVVVLVVGILINGATFNINADDVSLGGIGAYADLAALAAGATGGIYEVLNGSANSDWNIREKGSAWDIRKGAEYHNWPVSQCDANQVCEGYIERLTDDFFVIGWFGECDQNGNGNGNGEEATIYYAMPRVPIRPLAVAEAASYGPDIAMV